MKVEIISKEVVKPSSPTPTHLRNFKLSLLDQLHPSVQACLLYFYSSNPHLSVSQTSMKLKKSLSDTLTLFYPYAGKTVDNMKIDCNDNGALYVEARVDIPLSDFLQNPDDNDIHVFLAAKVESTEESNGFFSLFQVSFFACGGFAIGVSISHILADAASINTFMKTWAASMTGDFSNKLSFPVYEAANLFPATEILSNVRINPKFREKRFPSKRLVFNPATIASLKTNFRDLAPSKTELLTAIIWKSALNAARYNSRSSKQSPMFRALNIRRRTSPPLSSSTVGNTVDEEGNESV